MPTTTDRRQGVNSSAAVKVPCRCATTAAITLSGLQTVDGVALAADDRVLVKDQSTASQNGIYSASTGSWQRAADFDGALDVKRGTLAVVHSGTVNSSSMWQVTSSDPVVIGTSEVSFALIVVDSVTSLDFIQSGTGAVTRNAQDKMRDIRNIKDYGAVGDGIADDTSAFENAVLSAMSVELVSGETYLLSNGISMTTGSGFVCSEGYATIKIKTGSGGFNIVDEAGTRTDTDRCVFSCVNVDNITLKGMRIVTDGTKEVYLYPIRTSAGLVNLGIRCERIYFSGFAMGVLISINSAGQGAYFLRDIIAVDNGATQGSAHWTASIGQLTLIELDNDLVGGAHSYPGYMENIRAINLLHSGDALADFGMQTDVINIAGIGSNRKGPTIYGVYADGVGEVIDIFGAWCVIKGVRIRNAQYSYAVKLLHGAQFNHIEIDACESCALAVIGLFGSSSTSLDTLANTVKIGTVYGVGTAAGAASENAVVRFGGGSMGLAVRNVVTVDNVFDNTGELDYVVIDGSADSGNNNFVEIARAEGWAAKFSSCPPGNVKVKYKRGTRVRMTMSATQVLTSTVPTTVQFDTASVDVNGEAITASYKIRPKFPGSKYIKAQIRVALNADDDIVLEIMKNGASIAYTFHEPNSGVETTYAVSTVDYVNENEVDAAESDYTIRATITSAGTITLINNANIAWLEMTDFT